MDIQEWIADWLSGSYPDPLCDFNVEAVKFLGDLRAAGFNAPSLAATQRGSGLMGKSALPDLDDSVAVVAHLLKGWEWTKPEAAEAGAKMLLGAIGSAGYAVVPRDLGEFVSRIYNEIYKRWPDNEIGPRELLAVWESIQAATAGENPPPPSEETP